MKNLKKVLSLGLALVMLLGMMSFASAADAASTKLADMDKVTNKDEVSLLVDLGVISGIKEGDQMLYKPESNIQRDAWAKMVYYVMQGNADYKVLENSSNLKDIANNWANGCISYLATQKIVSGDDLGNYNPLRSIKVAEAAKTLLTAAGWDASDRDYTGASWSGSVMSDAKRFGLMNGIALTANDALTRDAAAKMIVNALDLEVVKAVRKPMYVGTGVDKFVDYYETQNTTLGHQAFGLAKVTGVVDELDEDGNIVFRTGTLKDATGTALAAADAAKVVIAGNASMVGQSVVIYVKANATYKGYGNGKIDLTKVDTVASVISSTPIKGGMTVLKTVTSGVNWLKCYDAPEKGETNDDFIVESDATVYYYANGVKAGTTAPANLNGGEVAEFCDTDDNGKADLVRVFNWQVAVVGDDGVKTTTKKDVTTVTVDGIATLVNIPVANVTGYESLEAGDVVLYYTNSSKQFVIEKAETVTGAIQFSKGGKLTVGGKAYAKSDIFTGETDKFASWTSDDDTAYIWALDKNGDVCYISIPAGVTVETKNAIVLITDSAKGNSASDLGISSSSSDQAKARLLLTDGTVEVVDVAKVGDTALKDATWNNEGKWSELLDLEGALVDYSVTDKKYTLTATEGVETIASGTEISADAKFDKNNNADNNTLFIVAKVTGTGDDAKVAYTTYTGFKTLPSMTTTEAGLMLKDNGYAKIVYLTTDKFEGDAPAGYVYVTSTETGLVAGQSYYTAAIINTDGELDEATKVADGVVKETGLFQIDTVDENGVITKLSDKITTDLVPVTEDIEMSVTKGVFTVGEDVYECDSKTKVIIVDLKANGTDYADVTVSGASKIAVKDDYASAQVLVSATNGLADTVWVIRVAAE